jgi:hypothetical protein
MQDRINVNGSKSCWKVKKDERWKMLETGGFEERKDSSAILLRYLGQMPPCPALGGTDYGQQTAFSGSEKAVGQVSISYRLLLDGSDILQLA